MSKPIPLWSKVVIGLAIFGTLLWGGIWVLTYMVLRGGGGERLAEMAVEKVVEKALEENGEEGAKVEVDLEGQKFSYQQEGTQNKMQFGEGVEIPADFPKDIPIFQPSRVKGVMNIGGTMNLNLATEKPVSEVATFYQSQLSGQGWSEVTALNNEGQFFGTYTKEAGQVTLAISPQMSGDASDTTMIGLTFAPQAIAPQ